MDLPTMYIQRFVVHSHAYLLDRQSKLELTHSQENVDFCVSFSSEPPCSKSMSTNI